MSEPFTPEQEARIKELIVNELTRPTREIIAALGQLRYSVRDASDRWMRSLGQDPEPPAESVGGDD